MRQLIATPAGRLAAGLVALLTLAVVIALVVLWPGDVSRSEGVNGSVTHTAPAKHEAKVVEVRAVRCPNANMRDCAQAVARFTEGPERGQEGRFDASFSGTSGALGVGDHVFLTANQVPEGTPGVHPYSLVGFQRHQPLLLLALVFVSFVIVLGRVRGLMALLGLALSLGLVVVFVVPAILDGSPPVLVALVGALAVMIITIVLCHGTGAQSVAAILGTTVSLAATVALAALFIGLTNISGISSEESQLVLAGRGDLSLDGLILAGLLIGALGVLDDLTVSQASTVMALRRAAPDASWRQLYQQAVTVGRDHVAATVNTLVLAYVGAALPILLIFSVGATSFGDAINIEQVAQEIVAMLVGSIGLMIAVPVTTARSRSSAPPRPPCAPSTGCSPSWSASLASRSGCFPSRAECAAVAQWMCACASRGGRPRMRTARPAATAVVSGTAAIRPIEPTSVPTIVSLTASRFTASPNGVSPTAKTSRIGSEAPT